MLWLKSCPKCGGDLSEDRDQYGPYITYIQCGHYLTEAEDVLLRYASRPRTSLPASQPIQAPRKAVGAGR